MYRNPYGVLGKIMLDTLGDRMKGYEAAASPNLIRRMPIIVRIDGKAFHTFCRGATKPFDDRIKDAMVNTCQELLKAAQNCKVAYTQSDEISLLFIDYEQLETDAWFSNCLQKIVSVSSSIATLAFNKHLAKDYGKWALFDARAWNLPREEVSNYFLWRQQDCRRNAVSQVARSKFSHKQLHSKNTAEMKDMLLSKGLNFETDILEGYRNGWLVSKDTVVAAPYFKTARSDIEQFLYVDEKQEMSETK